MEDQLQGELAMSNGWRSDLEVWLAPLEAALWRHADHLVGGERSRLIIDDTSLSKKGGHSVGVAPQYASTLGKKANCQTLASREVPLMLSLRLFLPDIWTADPTRLKRAGVPLDHQGFRTKPEMAIEEIDRLFAAGVRFGCVLADAGYGLSAPFRQALSARNLRWALGIPRHQKVYSADVELVFPARKRSPSRMHPLPDQQSVPAHKILETATWRRISWRRGTKGGLAARLAARRIHVAEGPAQRIGGRTVQHTENGNTICPTCLPTPPSGYWPLRSRPDGSANRRISNSGRNWASITLKSDHGRTCTDRH